MDKRKLIMRIALGISLAALAFSLVTVGRSIVLGSGVVPSLLLVFTTGIVVAVCYLMLRAYSNYEDGFDDDEAVEDEAEPAEAPARRRTERSDEPEAEPKPTRRKKRSHEPASEPFVLEAEPAPEPQPELHVSSASPDPIESIEPVEPSESTRDDISQQVDALISELERDSSYDLSNFE